MRQRRRRAHGISWPEVYTSLATGVVEGTKNGITDIVSIEFDEHLDHNHAGRPRLHGRDLCS